MGEGKGDACSAGGNALLLAFLVGFSVLLLLIVICVTVVVVVDVDDVKDGDILGGGGEGGAEGRQGSREAAQQC